MSKTGWVFSSRVFISGEKWMSDHDTMADFKHPVSMDVKGVESLDAFRGMEAEFKRRHDERQAKLKNYFMEDISQVMKEDVVGEVQMVGESRQVDKPQEETTNIESALFLLYGITIPFMTGIASGTGHSWDTSLGLGIIWPLWIPFEVGKAIGRILELLP